MAVRSEVVWYQEEVQGKNNKNKKANKKTFFSLKKKKNQIFRVFKNIFKKEKEWNDLLSVVVFCRGQKQWISSFSMVNLV